MSSKNKLLTMLILGSGAATSMALINKYIQISASGKNILEDSESLCYRWRFGNIHYQRTGNGKPLLLIHDLASSSSSYEWNSVVRPLSEHFTVYTIDLLGCGRSEKPNMTYTNYLYVQLICDFIKSVIGRRTSVITSGSSASLALMACSSNSNLFDSLFFINPDSLLSCSKVPGKSAKLYKFILDFPIIGTFIYHIACSRQNLQQLFMNEYYENPFSVKGSIVDAYYEAAHLGKSPKSLYASIACHYTKCNVINALKKIDNSIYIVGSQWISDMEERIEEYRKYNPAVESTMLTQGKQLPHLECPSQVMQAVHTYLY